MPIVDTRQSHSSDRDLITPFVRAGWTLQAMDHGDYGLETPDGMALVEHKRTDQFLTDMQSGQLMKQVRAMTESCRFPIFMRERNWVTIDGFILNETSRKITRYTLEEVSNEEMTIQNMGCRFESRPDVEGVIARIFELQKYYAKEIHESALRTLPGDEKLYALRLIHGVGASKARSILSEFGCLRGLALASVDQIGKVPGVGSVLGRRIHDFFS